MYQSQLVLLCIMAWYKSFGITTLIGVMLGIFVVVPALWIVSLAGVAAAVWYLPTVRTRWNGVLAGWWIFTVKASLALLYFWSAYPIDWLGFSLGPLEPVIIFFYWLTGSLWLGVGGVGLYIGLRLVYKVSTYYRLLLIPVVWLVADWLGAMSFSLFTLGPGGSINTQFSFGFIGYALAQHNMLIQIAAVAGVFGLTVLVVVLALGGLQLWQLNKRIILVGGVTLLLGTSVIPLAPQANTDDVYAVAVVNTQFPTDSRFTDESQELVRKAITVALEEAIAAGVDYVILPEDTRFFDQSDSDLLRAYATFRYGQSDTIIIDSGRSTIDGMTTLNSVIYDGTTSDIYQSQKRYLVPQGEFLPYLYEGILRLVGYTDVLDFLAEQLSYRVGDNTSQADFAANIPGVLFCFESNNPSGVRTIMKERNGEMPFVAHVISHAWFNDPYILWQQTEAMLRIQAIWNNTYIVSAGNHAPGYMIDPRGQITQPQVLLSDQYWELGLVMVPKN